MKIKSWQSQDVPDCGDKERHSSLPWRLPVAGATFACEFLTARFSKYIAAERHDASGVYAHAHGAHSRIRTYS